MSSRFVAYLRVSTKRQDESGLGLEAQREIVQRFLSGARGQLLEEVIEVESGGKNDRSQLHRAIALCRAWRATSVVAKLDRLSRSVKLIADLMDGGVEFVVAENPQMTHLTVHIMAAVAEHERKLANHCSVALGIVNLRSSAFGSTRSVSLSPNSASNSTRVCSSIADQSSSPRLTSKPSSAAVFTVSAL